MKKLVLVFSMLIVILLGVAIAGAEDTELTIRYTPVKDEITYEETAVFDVEIINPLFVKEEVFIVTPISDWGISLSETRLKIRAKESAYVNLTLTPPREIRPGKYVSCFTFKGLNHPSISNHRCIFVVVTEGLPIVEEPGEEEKEPEKITKVVIEEEELDKFMSNTHIITIKNVGNTIVSDEYTADFELLASFFVTSTPLSTGIRGTLKGKQYYWGYTLNPEEEMVITYSLSYFPIIFSVAVVVIALIFLMSFYTSGLKIDKKLLIPTSKVHGPKSVKVKLSIKNNTNREVENVEIEDYIPVPFKLAGHFGTLKPAIIKKLQDKTKLIWKISHLTPKEERLITYTFKSRLAVLGKIMLPRAKLNYTKKKTKQKSSVYSGILIVKGKKEERLE